VRLARPVPLLVVDGNNFCLRNAGGMGFRADGEVLQTSDGVPTSMVLGSINSLRKLLREVPCRCIVFTFDWGRSKFRQDIRAEYKSNRKESPFPFDPKPQFSMFQDFLDLVGITWIHSQGVEADDLIAAIVNKAQGVETTIVSADHDLLQLASDTVTVYRPSIGKTPEVFYTPKVVQDKYGLTPEQLPKMWALMGDSGDGVVGVKGIGPKTATKMILAHGDLYEVIKKEPKIAPYAELVMQNYDMIRLDGERFLDLIPDEIGVWDPNSHKPGLREYLARYELDSLVAKLDQGSLWN
jgi:DNA polymerase-1